MRPQNTSFVKQLSKITSTVHALDCLSGGHCIYGAYVVLPVVERLKDNDV